MDGHLHPMRITCIQLTQSFLNRFRAPTAYHTDFVFSRRTSEILGLPVTEGYVAGHHTLTRRSLGTTPRIISVRPLRRIHHLSSLRQVIVIWPQYLVPVIEFIHPVLFDLVKKEEIMILFDQHTQEKHASTRIWNVEPQSNTLRQKLALRGFGSLRETCRTCDKSTR
jgi:hypothetical protein